jgi:SAM-dependent MidA family methyltransferase
MSDNGELIALLRKLRKTGYSFTIDYGYDVHEDYELVVHDGIEVVYVGTGILRVLLRDALTQIEQAK